MVGIDQDVSPRSQSEARSIIVVITAMVVVSVGKSDLRPVALLINVTKMSLKFLRRLWHLK